MNLVRRQWSALLATLVGAVIVAAGAAVLPALHVEAKQTAATHLQSNTATPAEEDSATPTPAETSTVTSVDEDSAGPTREESSTATPAGSAPGDETAYATELRQRLLAEDYGDTWATAPGKGELYPGQAPHGARLTAYLNQAAMTGLEEQAGALPDGAIIVLENRDADQRLQSISVMEKRDGFAPTLNDWYYASYDETGAVQNAGRVESCIRCHAAVRSNDYIFTFAVAPVTDLSSLEEEATSTPGGATGEATATPAAADSRADQTDPVIAQGQEIYTNYCAACHQNDGGGIPHAYPALAGNPFVLAEDPAGVLRVVFTGRAGMPRFHDAFSVDEIGAVVSYIRNAWDNDASIVSPDAAQRVEEEVYSEEEAMNHNGSSE